MGRAALREALALWAAAFAAIALARAVSPWAKAVAAVAFLYLPGLVVWRREEDYRDYGASTRGLTRALAWGLGASLVVLPLFALGFFGFVKALAHVPDALRGLLAPYPSEAGLHLRLPDRLAARVLDQFLVVALPEEFFYRGYLQQRLRDAWPGGRAIFGMQLGRAFWATQALFAIGHLAEPHPWRLAVFFPSILFGLLREKTGSIAAPTVLHALSNLAVAVLEASFFG